MTTTLEALQKLASFAKRRLPMPEGAVETRRAVERLGGALGDVPREPPEDELERLRARLLELFTSGRGDEARPRELRRACWLLWSEGTPPGDAIPGLLEAILREAANSRRMLRTLIHCWLLARDAGRESHRRAGSELARLVAASDDPRFDRVRTAAAEIELFDAPRAANKLAHALLTGPLGIDELLSRCGLHEPASAASGMLERTLEAALRTWPNLARRRDAGAILERLLEFSLHERRLRFWENRGALASGLIAPWLLDAPPPPDELRSRVQRFLLDHLGDPRVKPAKWLGTDPRAVALFKSWLARASLRAFFDIIRDFALDRQWRYRERFWRACLERGAIQDVWLALASHVGAAARSVADLRGAYGELVDGVQSTQAVMLMRIGDFVLCEWSHDGRLRAWPTSWSNAPKLGRTSYSASELRSNSLPFPGGGILDGLAHIGAENGVWQEKAAAFLRERAGIDLARHEYRP